MIELKIKRKGADEIQGLEQSAEYMDTSGAKEGHLVLFDRDNKKSWDEKIYHKSETIFGKIIEVGECEFFYYLIFFVFYCIFTS